MNQDQKSSPRKLSIWLPLLFALVLVAGMLIGMRMQSNAPTVVVDSQEAALQTLGQGKIEEILRYIEAKYVDEVDREALIQEVIDDLLSKLDPHSNYISIEQLQEINEQLEGNFDGIGVEFMLLDDTIVVVAPLAGGPSEAAGIRAGDKIVEINDSTIAGNGIDTRGIISMLRGEKGTTVDVGILRGSEKKVRQFQVTRDEIPMHSVDVSYMLNGKTGYIKLNRFSATTYEEFMKALEVLVEKHNMEDLVIDLRHNPGGYLQQATNILSQLFSNKDKLMVYTEGRAVSRNDYETTGRSFFDIDDIVVLIDEGSASASEILAGAVQDQDRGLIIGRRSFGKGLVQEQYKLRDGSALRLTVARYYTPSGRSIQKPYEDPESYENEMIERYETGELQSEDRMVIADSAEYFTTGGRVVYGGGGIMPDIFVALDTVLLNEQYLQLRQYIPQFVFRYMDEKGDVKGSDGDLAQFIRRFQVDEDIYQEFLSYVSGRDGKVDQDSLPPAAKENLKRYIKARIAKHLFEDEGFYAIWNQEDPMIKEALRALENTNPLTASQK